MSSPDEEHVDAISVDFCQTIEIRGIVSRPLRDGSFRKQIGGILLLRDNLEERKINMNCQSKRTRDEQPRVGDADRGDILPRSPY